MNGKAQCYQIPCLSLKHGTRNKLGIVYSPIKHPNATSRGKGVIIFCCWLKNKEEATNTGNQVN